GPVIAAAQTATKPAAIVNGQTITEGQVATAAAKDLKKLGTDGSQSQRSAAMWKALNEMIADRILTAEAKKADRTKAELIQSEIDSDLPPPPAQVVETYYEFNKSRFPGPRAKAIEQVREYLFQRTRRNMLDAYVQRLSKQYGVKTFLPPLRKQIAT